VEENELRKDKKKSWKTMENTLINLDCFDFYCNKKIMKNWQELLHRPNIYECIMM